MIVLIPAQTPIWHLEKKIWVSTGETSAPVEMKVSKRTTPRPQTVNLQARPGLLTGTTDSGQEYTVAQPDVLEIKMVTQTTVIQQYGLTRRMVDLLGTPDEYAQNPHYRKAAPAKLYRIDRVEKWVLDHKAEVDRVLELRPGRSAAAARRFQAKYAQILLAQETYRLDATKWIQRVHLRVDIPSIDVVRASAQRYFGSKEVGWGGLIAHARHQFTNYEEFLDRDLGSYEYHALRTRVDDLVKKALGVPPMEFRQL